MVNGEKEMSNNEWRARTVTAIRNQQFISVFDRAGPQIL